jgi:hypothetical protein
MWATLLRQLWPLTVTFAAGRRLEPSAATTSSGT